MLTLESLAYASRLRGVSPALKAAFSLFGLFACLIVNTPAFSALILFVMSIASTAFSGLGVKTYAKLCAIPLIFIVFSCGVIALEFSPSAAVFGTWVHMPFFGGFAGVTAAGAAQSAALCLKAFAAFSCLCFLCVSTPMHALLNLLAYLHVPALLTELFMLTYRFIFILLELGLALRTAQLCRMGYAKSGRSFMVSLSLFKTVFICGIEKSTALYNSMLARGYNGTMPAAALSAKTQRSQLILTILCILLLAAAGAALKIAW